MAPIRHTVKYIYDRRYFFTYLLIIVLVATAFFYRLSNLTPGPHNAEIDYLNQYGSLSLRTLTENIIFLPHAFVSWLFTTIDVNLVTIRASSAFFGATMVPMLYTVLRIWHTRRIATIGVLLLLSSSWFIGLARLGTPDIMYAWGIMAALTGMTLVFHHRKHTKWRHYVMISSGILIGLSLYSPYSIYLYVLVAIIAHRNVVKLVDELGHTELISLLTTTLITVAPLIGVLVAEPSTSLTLIGYPDSLPTLTELLTNTKNLFSHIFWRSDASLIGSVGNLSLLGIFGASTAALGMYHYEQHLNNLRTHLIVGLFFGLFIIMAVDYDPAKTSALIPLVYILISMGTLTLLTQWYRVFPHNPFARTMGFILVGSLITFTAVYHNQRYFASWARSPETKIAFSDDVVLIENEVKNTITANDSIRLNMSEAYEYRVKSWLSYTVDSKVTVDDPDAKLLLVGPNTKAVTDGYTLEHSIDTTSILKPLTYQFYLKDQ